MVVGSLPLPPIMAPGMHAMIEKITVQYGCEIWGGAISGMIIKNAL